MTHVEVAPDSVEEALSRCEQQMRAIFDGSFDAMLLLDDRRRCVDANPSACKLLGLALQKLTGREWSVLIDGIDHDATWHLLEQQGTAAGDARISAPGGGLRHVEFTARGKILPDRHLLVFRDLTDRETLEAQFRQAQKMEAVGRLAGGVAHDFNNMLTGIRGYTELLLKRMKKDDPLRDYVAQIQEAGDRAAMTTQQLLAFSRRQVLQPKVLVINAVVNEMVKLMRRLIGEDIVLEMDLAPDLAPTRADPGQLGQILLNLAVNARDAMPDGGKLTVRTANANFGDSANLSWGAYVLLEVADTGCGMNEEVQAHIFEPFFTTKEQDKGTGLGLATVYGIVNQSGGFIDVASKPGAGSSFRIYLPRVDEKDEDHAGAKGANHARGSVLLLVENESLRELLQVFLTREGFTVATNATSSPALLVGDSASLRQHISRAGVPAAPIIDVSEFLEKAPGAAGAALVTEKNAIRLIELGRKIRAARPKA